MKGHSHLIALAVAIGGISIGQASPAPVSAVTTSIFFENFNSLTPGTFATQADTGLRIGAWFSLAGWTYSGTNAIHIVERTGAGDLAATFYSNNEIVTTAAVAPNSLGITYLVTYEAGPSVTSAAHQASNASDGLNIILEKSNGSAFKTIRAIANPWNGTLTAQTLTTRSFMYVGDGSGSLKIRINTFNVGADRFGGAIDNLRISSVSEGCPSVNSTTGNDTVVKITAVGSCKWTVPTGVNDVRVLVVGGGGGGGSDNGGGGGAGGLLNDESFAVTPGELIDVVVGAGGLGATSNSTQASKGSNSSFKTLTAIGGGGGGSIDNTAGGDGGSAGGRAANRSGNAESAIVTTSPTQGNNGGSKTSGGFGGGGGGGASTAGASGGSNVGGNGGAGRSISITGSAVTYGGGGGGGGDSNTAGTGGLGGGGNGSSRGDQIPTAGTNELGGGGGGAGGSVAGGLGRAGGSGVVIIRYSNLTAPINSVAPVVSGTARSGQTLTATAGTWSGDPTPNYTYQWKSSSTVGGSYTNISGATSSTFNLTNDEVGKYVKVAVTATNSVSSVTELSAATSVVSAISTTTTVAPVVEIVVNAPGTTVAVGQASVATIPSVAVKPSAASTVVPRSLATTTTVAAVVTPPGPVVPPAPKIEAVAAGEVGVKVGDKTEKATVERLNNQYVVSVGPLKATFAALSQNGASVPLDEKGTVRMKTGDKVKITMNGFQPGSTIEAWLFSTPALLGTAKVGTDGSVTGIFTIPANAEDGSHRIALVAKANNGKPTTFTVGVMVGEWDGGPNVTLWLIVLPIVLAVGGALAIPATRRRRKQLA